MRNRSRLDTGSNWNGAGDGSSPLFEACNSEVKWRTWQCKIFAQGVVYMIHHASSANPPFRDERSGHKTIPRVSVKQPVSRSACRVRAVQIPLFRCTLDAHVMTTIAPTTKGAGNVCLVVSSVVSIHRSVCDPLGLDATYLPQHVGRAINQDSRTPSTPF